MIKFLYNNYIKLMSFWVSFEYQSNRLYLRKPLTMLLQIGQVILIIWIFTVVSAQMLEHYFTDRILAAEMTYRVLDGFISYLNDKLFNSQTVILSTTDEELSLTLLVEMKKALIKGDFIQYKEMVRDLIKLYVEYEASDLTSLEKEIRINTILTDISPFLDPKNNFSDVYYYYKIYIDDNHYFIINELRAVLKLNPKNDWPYPPDYVDITEGEEI